MTARVAGLEPAAPRWPDSARLSVGAAGALSVEQTLVALASGIGGLSGAEAAARLATVGPNAVRSHHIRAWVVLGRQLRSALLVLLVVTATISFFLGDSTDAVIIGLILAASVGLGFVNEYRAERAAQALHSEIRHTAVAVRD
jgi:Mg2+-importing ATPase